MNGGGAFSPEGPPLPWLLAGAALAACAPLVVTSGPALNFLATTLIVALAAQGWNILGGYAGGFSFGHAAFFGTGAYLAALLPARHGLDPWAAFALAVTGGAALAAVVGAAAFRAGLRGSYFALVTLAVAEVLRVLANASAYTGGAAGVLVPLDPRLAALQFPGPAAAYLFVLALVVGAMLLTRALARSRLGARMVAVREDEDAARALGVDAYATKLAAIALSGAVTAAAGACYARVFLYVDAGIAYGVRYSVEALVSSIVGGAGTVLGPVFGAFLLHGLGEAAKAALGGVPGVDLALFGVLLVLAVRFPPRDLLARLGRRRASGAP